MRKSVLLLVLLALVLAACAPASRSAEDSAGYAPQAPAPAPPAYGEGMTSDEYSFAVPASAERVVIKNASMEIVVDNPIAATDTISRMAEEMGGFVVYSNVYRVRTSRGLEVPEANVTVRVPAKRLTEAMDRIRSLVGDPGKDVLLENVSGEDVTQQYTDLQSRLRNQEDAAESLRKVLDEARRTEDVLAVYKELNRVTEQIELLKGQIKYYEESSRLSAISVRIQSEEAVAPITVAGWTPVGVARDALQTLINTLQFLADASIWIVVLCLPLGLLVLVPGYFIFRGYRRYRARQRTIAPPAQD